MKKKDYVLIADSIKSINNEYFDYKVTKTLEELTRKLSTKLAEDNPKFSIDKFWIYIFGEE